MREEGDPYAIHLARQLHRTVAELDATMSMTEYAEQIAYDNWRIEQQKLEAEKAKRRAKVGDWRGDDPHPGAA